MGPLRVSVSLPICDLIKKQREVHSGIGGPDEGLISGAYLVKKRNPQGRIGQGVGAVA